MHEIFSYVRYSNASINVDSYYIIGGIIFFLLCGIIIFQSMTWEEEDYSRNKKWLIWKSSAIKANKADLSNIYPVEKNKSQNL